MPEMKPVTDALSVECAIKGLTLRRVDAPVAGETLTAGAKEQIVLPDDCSFTSTVMPDGTREYRIAERTDAEKLEAVNGR